MISNEYKSYPHKNKISYDFTSNTNNGNSTIGLQQRKSDNYSENKQNISGYFYTMPANLNIFSKVENHIAEIKSINIKNFLVEFIQLFQSILSDFMNIKQISNFLPSIIIQEEEEDYLFLEWIFKDFRIGFMIEENLKDSTWYMITNKNLEEFSISGQLYTQDIYFTITKLINYVLENT